MATNINAYKADLHNAIVDAKAAIKKVEQASADLLAKLEGEDPTPATLPKTESAGLEEDTASTGQNKGKGKYR